MDSHLAGRRNRSQPGAPEEAAGLGGGVGFSWQVACVDCDHGSLFHLPAPTPSPRALPGDMLGPEFLVLGNKKRIN